MMLASPCHHDLGKLHLMFHSYCLFVVFVFDFGSVAPSPFILFVIYFRSLTISSCQCLTLILVISLFLEMCDLEA